VYRLPNCKHPDERSGPKPRQHPLPDYYRQRQQVTEHPFGTLKQSRSYREGFPFTLMKGKEKVLGEVGLEFIGYNLKHCASILGLEELRKTLK